MANKNTRKYPNFADVISRIFDLTKINVRLLSEYLFIVYTSVFGFSKNRRRILKILEKTTVTLIGVGTLTFFPGARHI